MVELDEPVCSNCDGIIEYDVVEQLMAQPNSYAEYLGWNFHWHVYFHNGYFHCEVWVYGSPVKTITEDTMTELREAVCDEYGYQ